MREIRSSYDSDTRKFVIARSEWANGSMGAYQEMDSGMGAFACIANPGTDKPWDWTEAIEAEKLPEQFMSCCVGIFLQCVVPDLHPLSIMGINQLTNNAETVSESFSESSKCLVDHTYALVELAQSVHGGRPLTDVSTETLKKLDMIYAVNDDSSDGVPNGGSVVIEDKEADLTERFKDSFDIELSFID